MDGASFNIEKQLLSAIMNPLITTNEVFKSVTSDDFKDSYCRKLFDLCMAIHSSGSTPTQASVLVEGLKLGFMEGASDQSKVQAIAQIDTGDKSIKELLEEFKAQSKPNMAKPEHEGIINNPLKPVITCLDDIQSEEISWLWPAFLATRKLTMLEGDPGDGKTFMSLALIAIITNGWPFPDESGKPDRKRIREPGNVLYLTAEDGLADTIKPRLETLGADHKRVFVLEGYFKENDTDIQQVTLADLNILRVTFEQVKPVLVVVDPLQAYLGAGVDMHRANEVRPVLSGIMRLAEEFNTAVIFIRHLNKASGGKALYRGMGSIDFNAAARSVLLVGRDPDDRNKRVVIQTKSSLMTEAPSIGFTLDENGFTWTGISDLTADQVLSQFKEDNGNKSAVEEAKDFLEDILSDGPIPANEIYSKSSKAGISKASIRRAKDSLDIHAYKEPGKGRDAPWMWRIRRSTIPNEHLEHLIETPNSVRLEIDAQGTQKDSVSIYSEELWSDVGQEIKDGECHG